MVRQERRQRRRSRPKTSLRAVTRPFPQIIINPKAPAASADYTDLHLLHSVLFIPVACAAYSGQSRSGSGGHLGATPGSMTETTPGDISLSVWFWKVEKEIIEAGWDPHERIFLNRTRVLVPATTRHANRSDYIYNTAHRGPVKSLDILISNIVP